MTEPKCSRPDCETGGQIRRGMCVKHYVRFMKHGDANVTKKGGVRPRFWEHVQITTTCWLWTGPKSPLGYGRSSSSGAHRRVYEYLIGRVPEDMDLDHLCRVRNCVRPDHLEVVTHAENVRRGYAARRAA